MDDYKHFQFDNQAPGGRGAGGDSTRTLKVLVVLLGLLAAGLGITGYVKYKQLKKAEHVLEGEKEALLNDLNELKVNYDNLSTENTELKSKVDEAKSKVEQLIAELQKVKKADAEIIAKFRRQVIYFRKQRDKLLKTVDSLKRANQILVLQKDSLGQELAETQEYNKQIVEENQHLAEKVQKAQTLTPVNIHVDGVRIRKNGKVVVTHRKWRTQQIRVCMIMPANPVAERGNKTVYVQVINPDGKVIGSKDVITVNGDEVIVSGAKQFNYTGQNTEVCVFVKPEDKKAELLKGDYLINIYQNGQKTGTTNFQLK